MAKGKNSKKETKKPKKEKPKISATANSIAGKPMIGAKKQIKNLVVVARRVIKNGSGALS